MRTLTVELPDSAFLAIAREARARRMKPGVVAQEVIESHVAMSQQLERKFRDAAAEVDRRLAAA